MYLKRLISLLLIAFVAGSTVSEQTNVNNNNFCQGCRSIVSFASRFNSSELRGDYQDLFKGFCELYYPVSTDFQQGPCPLFVEGLFYVLDHTNPIHHCDEIGACGAGRASMPSDDIYDYLEQGALEKSTSLAVSSMITNSREQGVICEFCEQMVEQVQATLSNPNTIEQIRQQADALCEYLKVIDQEKECNQLINNYLDQAIEFIQNIKPLDYCKSIQMCRSKESIAVKQSGRKPVDSHLPTLADFNNFGIETSVVIGGEKRDVAQTAGSLSATPNCMICKTVVKEMFHFLRENKTEANIIANLDRICGLIYKQSTGREQCQSMVNAYTRELIQLLIDETDPEVICMILEQCAYKIEERKSVGASDISTPSDDEFGLSELIWTLDPTTYGDSKRACFECKMFMRYMKDKLSDPKSADEVKIWLKENLCHEMPEKNLVDKCSAIVDQYAQVLFEMVVNKLNPTTACVELGVCSRRKVGKLIVEIDKSRPALKHVISASTKPSQSLSSKQSMNSQIFQINKPRQVKGQLCDQCVEIVSQIDEYMSNHPIDQDVSVLIDKVCNKLPDGSARDECTFIIKTFGAEIVQAISTMDNPRQLCSKIFLC